MTVMPSNGPYNSYWQATTPHLPLADIVLVGAGLLGAATCYWLTQAGMKPLLLEQTAAAFGATGRNGGFVSLGPGGGYALAALRLGAATASAVLRVTRENQGLIQPHSLAGSITSLPAIWEFITFNTVERLQAIHDLHLRILLQRERIEIAISRANIDHPIRNYG
jgi:2-polyprenyl-6-methoxyphenol hydroxylase-like FAD-dependent oxidoreductase